MKYLKRELAEISEDTLQNKKDMYMLNSKIQKIKVEQEGKENIPRAKVEELESKIVRAEKNSIRNNLVITVWI